MSGPSFLEGDGATANAGLHDQRLTLEWIQKYIHLFGGNPNRVTVIGESAGAGSIEHHITGYAGNRKAIFQQAILQSPEFKPKPDLQEQERIFQKTLSYASLVSAKRITTTQELRELSFFDLYYTNYLLVQSSTYGDFTFGPVVDGLLVPDLPGKLLLDGKFDHNLRVMVAYNYNEGLVFSSPFFQNTSDFDNYVSFLLPSASSSVLKYITDILYPNTSGNDAGYESQVTRTALFNTEFTFTCNTRFLGVAFKNQTYAYLFSVPPGIHEDDVPYTFFNGDRTTVDDEFPVNATIAQMLQGYVTSFAMAGSPNRNAIPYFPIYGSNSSTQVIGFEELRTQVFDEAMNARCTVRGGSMRSIHRTSSRKYILKYQGRE
jgi:carboxylesterase type B